VTTETLIINPKWKYAQFVSIAELKECEQKLEAANQRIKRLEEAGNAMAGYLGDGYSLAVNWTKAKEAKP